MKIIRMLLPVAVALLGFAACSEKKPTQDIITHKVVKKTSTEPVKMQNYDHSETVEWGGVEYKVFIGRRAENDSVFVRDEAGNKYHNNRITVRIVRPDGTEFLDKTFTKADFASVVAADYRERSTLLGIVVDHVDDSGLWLAASVGSPDALSDDYMPLLMTISRMGSISITKDTRLDADAEPADDDI